MSYDLANTAYCIEYFYAKPGCREKLITSLMKLIEPTKAEEKCLLYELLQDNNNPDLMILIVKFSNQQSMTHHEQRDFVKHFSENEMKKYCEKLVWNDAREIIK